MAGTGGPQPTSGIGRRRDAARAEGSPGYQAKRRELIHAAATVFAEKGFEAATLNDIAERVGTDRATLYYYFGSKQELLQEAVRGVLRRILPEQLIKQAIAEGRFRDDVEPDLAANALFGMINWSHRWFKPGKRRKAEDLSASFWAIFFDGMSNPG